MEGSHKWSWLSFTDGGIVRPAKVKRRLECVNGVIEKFTKTILQLRVLCQSRCMLCVTQASHYMDFDTYYRWDFFDLI